MFLRLTQLEMAAAIGSGDSYLSQVETRAARCGDELALKLVDRFRLPMLQLGITVEDLIRGTRARPVETDGDSAS